VIARRCFDAQGGGKIFTSSDVYISGGGQRFYYQIVGGIIQHTTSTVFITANVSFSVAFCESDRHGIWIKPAVLRSDKWAAEPLGARPSSTGMCSR
jgi:hypothetical protein